MYEFKLKKGILVHDLQKGDYVESKIIKVIFKGRKGLLSISALKDIVYEKLIVFIQKQQENKREMGIDPNKENKIATKKEDAEGMLQIIYALGNTVKLEESTLSFMEEFATINNVKLSSDLQEEMDIDDLRGLVRGVLEHFLVPILTQK